MDMALGRPPAKSKSGVRGDGVFMAAESEESLRERRGGEVMGEVL